MNKLMKEIEEKRNITASTLKMYRRTLNNISLLFTGKPFKSITFLKKNHADIVKKLEEMTSSKEKNYLSTMLVVLSPKRGEIRKGYRQVYNKYKELLSQEHKAYEKRVKEGTKTQKEEDNMVDPSELHKVRQRYENNIKHIGYTQKSKGVKKKKHLDLLQKYLVSALYTLMQPRRNAFANMKVISSKEYNKLSEDDQNQNYLVIYSRNKKEFVFGDYKTQKKHGIQIIPLYPDDNWPNGIKKGDKTLPKTKTPKDYKKLNSIINLWLNFSPNKEYFLFDSRGNPLTPNGLTKYINKVFKPTGKKIGASMIRKIFLTDKYGEEKLEKEKDAEAMGHDVETQNKYIKKA